MSFDSEHVLAGPGTNDTGRDAVDFEEPLMQANLQASNEFKNGSATGVRDILSVIAFIFISLVGLSVGLLGMVFVRRIQHTTSKSNSLLIGEEDESGVYYIRISATTLVLLSSLSSTIASIIVSFFMSLVAYPISHSLLQVSNSRNLTGLPTPYQLGLLVMSLNGQIVSLWHWTKDRFSTKVRTPKVVTKSLSALAIANILVYGHSTIVANKTAP